MNTTLRSLAVAVLGVVTLVAARSAPPDGGDDVTSIDMSAAQTAIVDQALARFDAAGLDLPPIVVTGHPHQRRCRGHPGVHRVVDGQSHIDLCVVEAGPRERFLVLHELAHAWERAALTPERREEFLRLRGLDAWRNDDPDRWHERGAEHAAEIVAWGLHERAVPIVRIGGTSCDELLAAFRFLTGGEPQRADACADAG